MLFSSDLSRLTAALQVSPEKIRAKGIASVRERVTNLTDVPGFPSDMTVQAFMDHLAHTAVSADAELIPLTEEEIGDIRVLRDKKYATWEWNFGASLRHETEKTCRFPFGTLHASYTAVGGVIESIRLHGDYFGQRSVAELENTLIGIPLREDALTAALDAHPTPVREYIHGASAEDIVRLIVQ